jgi:hypothetical protein
MLALVILLLLAVHIAEAHNAVLHLKHGFAHLEGSSVKQGGRGMSRGHFQRLIDHDRARMQRRLAVVDFPLSGNDDPLVTGSVFPGILSLSHTHTHAPLPSHASCSNYLVERISHQKGKMEPMPTLHFWPCSKQPSDAKKALFFWCVFVCVCACLHMCALMEFFFHISVVFFPLTCPSLRQNFKMDFDGEVEIQDRVLYSED